MKRRVGAAVLRVFLIPFLSLTVIAGCASCRSITVDRDGSSPDYKNLDNYDPDFTCRLIDRVKPPPDCLLSYLSRADNMPSYVQYMPTPGELAIIEKELDLLPGLHSYGQQ